MRVLDTTTFELKSGEQELFKQDGYAILSHRWVGMEITFDQLPNHIAELKQAAEKQRMSPQLGKIRGACDLARGQGIRWMWIDTCCINKSSTVEETESINSMFKWYRDAKVCITYLFDVDSSSTLGPPTYNAAVQSKKTEHASQSSQSVFQRVGSDRPSEWFSRGWTLQELLAPRVMQFYDRHWQYIGTKSDLAPELERITGIEVAYLTGAKHFRKACIATKLSWQAGRTTAREEDIAYSMLGIFNIIMTPQYGEGSRAFMRLQHALLTTTTDESLFAWRMPSPTSGAKYDIEADHDANWGADEWGLLAPTPDWFAGCGRVVIDGGRKIERPGKGFQATRQGLQISFPPISGYGKYKAMLFASGLLFCLAIPIWIWIAKKIKREVAEHGMPFPLNCWRQSEAGTLAAVQIHMQPLVLRSFTQEGDVTRYKRIRCSELSSTTEYATKVLGSNTNEGFVVQPELSYDS
ncbi:hypothetical protein ACN47E_001222 [Coniothyrium glycines]